MQKHDRTYSAGEFRRKVCVMIMKCNIVLPGKTYRYYPMVNMLVYLDKTNKTYLENANLL